MLDMAATTTYWKKNIYIYLFNRPEWQNLDNNPKLFMSKVVKILLLIWLNTINQG